MKGKTVILAPLAIVLVSSFVLADVPEITGDISSVIVYRGRASVKRTIEVDLPQGSCEFIVKNLPARIVPESLYAQAGGQVSILSVRYRERATPEDSREEVKQLDAQIEELGGKIRHAEANRRLIDQHLNTLNKLENFTISAHAGDLNRGLLQAEPVTMLANHIETKRTEYNKSMLELEDELIQLRKQMDYLRRQQQTLAAGYLPIERETVVSVNKTDNQRATLELYYLVSGATWTAQYNLRANPAGASALIEYNALVNQTSGEDWTNATLALSTAEPAIVASAPILEPMKVTLQPGGLPAQTIIEKDRQIASPQMQQQQTDYPQLLGRSMRERKELSSKGIIASEKLNVAAAGEQLLEFAAGASDVQQFKKEIAEIKRAESVTVTYNLPGRLTLPSRSDQQLVSIASIPTKAEFIFVATPLLTDYVYLQGELLNDSDTVLLPGQAVAFCDGQFVGNGNVPLVTIGQKFTTGFGVDSRIQVAREFEEKKSNTLWGNRVDENRYRIAIDNYKNTAVKLQLFERLPYTENEDLQIYGFQTNTALSSNDEYLRTARNKGVLRWDLNLKPNSVDKNATIVTYSFTMKYDNEMKIAAAK
jgi:prefoldin subunit 5